MLSKETFEKELEICRAQFHRQKGCAWGKCENCGAPLTSPGYTKPVPKRVVF